MVIGIDISMLVYLGSGVATYTYELVRHLLKSDKENEYRLFYSSRRKPQRVLEHLDEFKKLGAKVVTYPLPPWFLNLIWNRWQVLPVEWLIGKVDIYHSSDFLRPPLLPGTKGITTIHDLTWKIYPEYHTQDIVKGHERKLKRTIKAGDTIIVDSNNTKKDLLKFYPQIEDNDVHVIPLGVSERFKPVKNISIISDVLKKYHIPINKAYLLYVGAIEPRKRLDLAIKVFAELLKEKKYADYIFVIAGRAGWKNEEIFELVNKLQLEKIVIYPGYIEDIDLPALYSDAKLFVYLSDYEGFGLPPLEALACGTKVICSNKASLPETIPLNYQCQTENVERITQHMIKILNNPLHRAEIPIWADCAKQTLEVLNGT